MTRTAALALALALAFALALGPGGCRETRAPELRAPALPRAMLLLEPPRLGVGAVATLELAVATPPGHALRPLALPELPAGLELLGVEALPVERDAARWLHRTRLAVRARALGPLRWPGGVVEIEAPDGSLASVAYEAHPVDVVPIAPEFPEQQLPFGVREPPDLEPQGGAGVLVGALAGAALALAGVAFARARRARHTAARRARRGSLPSAAARAPEPAAEPPWEEARRALAGARALAPRDPFAASDAAARALRAYASRRFAVGALARTSEELAAAPAPFAASTRWPILVAALRELDAHRFRPRDDRDARAALERELGGALAAAERFVEETLPPGAPG